MGVRAVCHISITSQRIYTRITTWLPTTQILSARWSILPTRNISKAPISRLRCLVGISACIDKFQTTPISIFMFSIKLDSNIFIQVHTEVFRSITLFRAVFGQYLDEKKDRLDCPIGHCKLLIFRFLTFIKRLILLLIEGV